MSRLSEADLAWIEQYRAFVAPRTWGDPADEIRGRLVVIRNDRAELLLAGKRFQFPFAEMVADDFAHIEAFYTHVEKTLPEGFLQAQQAVAKPQPPAALGHRVWTDNRGRRIEAEYGGLEGDKAILLVKGRRFDFPLNRLSDADRVWIAEQNLDQLQEELGEGFAAAKGLLSQALAAAAAHAQSNPPRPPAPKPVTPATPPSATAAPRVATAPRVADPAPEPPDPLPEPAASTAAPEPVSASRPSASRGDLGVPPWINHIDDLSPNEVDKRLLETFGEDYFDLDWQAYKGEASCDRCNGYFEILESFQDSDPCPFCGLQVTDVERYPDEYFEEDDRGWRTPWYLRRSGRRLIIFVVVTVIGAGVKLMMSGGD